MSIERSMNGDLRAFELVIERYGRSVSGYFHTKTKGTWFEKHIGMHPDDLSQETWIKAWKSLENGSFQSSRPFPPYLMGIARKVFLRSLRNIIKDHVLIPFDEIASKDEEAIRTVISETIYVDEETIAEIQTKEIISIIRDILSETYSKPLILYAFWGLSYTEIADLLDLSMSAIKMRLNRARQKLLKAINEKKALIDYID